MLYAVLLMTSSVTITNTYININLRNVEIMIFVLRKVFKEFNEKTVVVESCLVVISDIVNIRFVRV